MRTWRYTAIRSYPKWGKVHAANSERLTRCGRTINPDWILLTNRQGEGDVTCRQCLKLAPHKLTDKTIP